MYKNYKIVVVTPAGRQRYMEVLLPYILANRHVVDKYQIWLNTRDLSDVQYIESLALQYPDFIEVKETGGQNRPEMVGRNDNIRLFFKDCVDQDTIYIRLDDDIVFLEEGFFETLAQFRIDNPRPFIVYPLIINSVGTSFLLQQHGKIPLSWGRIGQIPSGAIQDFCNGGFYALDPVAWGDPEFAYRLHFAFLASRNNLDHWKFDRWDLTQHEYVSINSFCWFGKDFAEFEGNIEDDNEEGWFNVWAPKKFNKINSVCGQTICVHYAYYSQRAYLDSTKILSQYRELCP